MGVETSWEVVGAGVGVALGDGAGVAVGVGVGVGMGVGVVVAEVTVGLATGEAGASDSHAARRIVATEERMITLALTTSSHSWSASGWTIRPRGRGVAGHARTLARVALGLSL